MKLNCGHDVKKASVSGVEVVQYHGLDERIHSKAVIMFRCHECETADKLEFKTINMDSALAIGDAISQNYNQHKELGLLPDDLM